MLSSQSMVLVTAMVVSSSTLLYLAFSKPKSTDDLSKTPNLRSCLLSDKKKKKNKKKKRVKFAENVKETKGNGEEYRRKKEKFLFLGRQENQKFVNSSSCRNEIQGLPANRIALYNGILKDRVHRIKCS